MLFHSVEMFGLCMKLQIGLYIDLLIRAGKAQGDICAITTQESSDRAQGRTKRWRRRKRDGEKYHLSYGYGLWVMCVMTKCNCFEDGQRSLNQTAESF